MGDRDSVSTNTGTDQDDAAGRTVYNMPDSDVIETVGNTTGVGTTTVPDALPDVPGNNPSPNPGTTGTRFAEGGEDIPVSET